MNEWIMILYIFIVPGTQWGEGVIGTSQEKYPIEQVCLDTIDEKEAAIREGAKVEITEIVSECILYNHGDVNSYAQRQFNELLYQRKTNLK